MTDEPAPDPGVAPFVGMDVYLFDQLVRGRVAPGARVLDVGAGSGRNIAWLLEQGYEVTAVEPREDAWLAMEERLGARGLSAGAVRLVRTSIEDAPLEPASFDLVICNAVLHFAANDAHFDAMLEASWSAVAPGGVLFTRLASAIGIEERVVPLGEGRFFLPDETERYLVDERRLVDAAARLGALQLDPIKTTVVQGLRAMTTWVLGRPLAGA